MKVMPIVRKVLFVAQKNSPIILAGLAVTGVWGTGWFATKAGMKAKPIIDQMKAEGKTNKEIIEEVAPLFLPAALMGAVTTGCIIGSTAISEKRNAVYASLCSASELALTEYQKKTLETVGEKTEQAIRDKVAEQKVIDHPLSERTVTATGKGDTLCYDEWSDRYFTSDLERIRQIENVINQRIISHMWVTLNEVYYELGLGRVKYGDNVGFNVDHMLRFTFSTTFSDDERPCAVIGFEEEPRSWNG